MIHNDEQLTVVREQLGRLKRALQSLKGEVRPKSEAWFDLMSESYVQEIAKLRRQITQYRASGSRRTATPAKRRSA